KGRYPQILEDDTVGEAARALFRDAQELLDWIVEERLLTARAVVGLYPAYSVGDDVVVQHCNGNGQHGEVTVHFLRQQMERPPGRPNYSLADFIAPRESGVQDYMGFFAVTSGIGLEQIVRRFKEQHDDYNAILTKAL